MASVRKRKHFSCFEGLDFYLDRCYSQKNRKIPQIRRQKHQSPSFSNEKGSDYAPQIQLPPRFKGFIDDS
jgi:hypothetical protein